MTSKIKKEIPALRVGNLAKKGTEPISFTCYEYMDGNRNLYTLFLFYPKGMWDENKLTLQEALVKYPPHEYNWLFFDDKGGDK